MKRHLTFVAVCGLTACGLACYLGSPGQRPASAQEPRFLNKNVANWLTDLASKDAKVRANAAFALGKMGSHAQARGVQGLKQTLKNDKDAKVREAAAFALGEIAKESLDLRGDPDLVSLLAEKLKNDPDKYVRRSAACSLGSLGPDAESAQAALESALADSEPVVRQNVAWALGRVGPKSVNALRAGLKDADPLVKRDVAGSLGVLGNNARPALPELLACCKTETSDVRRAALAVVIKLVGPEDKDAIEFLRDALRDPDVEVRWNAALAMGNIGGTDAASAEPILRDALAKGDLDMKRQAAAILRNLGPDASPSLNLLRKALRSPDDKLRANAASAIGGIGKYAESAVPELVDLLTNPKEETFVRAEAATSMAHIGPVQNAIDAVPQMLTVLEDPRTDARIRERIVWALRVHNINLTNLKAFPTFVKVLGEPKKLETRMLRYDCAYMLGMLQGPATAKETLEVLHDYLHDDSILIFRKRESKSSGIGEVPKVGIEQKDLGKGDGRVMAVQALTQIGPERVRAHQNIMRQLRAIAGNNSLDPELLEKTKQLLDKIGK